MKYSRQTYFQYFSRSDGGGGKSRDKVSGNSILNDNFLFISSDIPLVNTTELGSEREKVDDAFETSFANNFFRNRTAKQHKTVKTQTATANAAIVIGKVVFVEFVPFFISQFCEKSDEPSTLSEITVLQH